MWKRPGRKPHQRKKVKLKRIRRRKESPSSQMKGINCGVGWVQKLGRAFLKAEQNWHGLRYRLDREGQSTCKARTKARHGGSRVMAWALERRL
jgi:hypothetical protein